MKVGVIDVGGGLRGIYAAGVLDYCLDSNIMFDIGIGISAGSANLTSYAAKQRGRNYTFYTEYAFRKEYMSVQNFKKYGSYINLDYVYGTLCQQNGENPIDYDTLCKNPMELYIVATDAITGNPIYFDKTFYQLDQYDILKASSSIPFVCKPIIINDIPYYDGALGDPIPIDKAFQMGCDYVVVILTKPESEIRNAKKDTLFAHLIQRKYPEAAKQLRLRASKYNSVVQKVQKYAKEGKAIIIAPDNTCGVDTLSRNKDTLIQLYEKGYNDGKKIKEFLISKDS